MRHPRAACERVCRTGESAFLAVIEGIEKLIWSHISMSAATPRIIASNAAHPLLKTSSFALTANTGNSRLHSLPISPNTPSGPYSLFPIE